MDGATQRIRDYSGYARNLTPQNFAGTDVEYISGPLGQSVELDGVDDYLDSADVAGIQSLCGSVEIVFHPADLTAHQCLISTGEDGVNGDEFGLFFRGDVANDPFEIMGYVAGVANLQLTFPQCGDSQEMYPAFWLLALSAARNPSTLV